MTFTILIRDVYRPVSRAGACGADLISRFPAPRGTSFSGGYPSALSCRIQGDEVRSIRRRNWL